MMYEIKQKERTIDGVTFPTWERDVVSCNILSVEAGTTGPQGGDSGHGCRTYFRIKDEAATDMEIKPTLDRWGTVDGFEVELGGDTELATMIEALKFIVHVFEEQECEMHGI